MCLSLGSIRATMFRNPSNSGGTIDPVPVEYRRHHRLEAAPTRKFQVRSAETFWNQRMPGSWREREMIQSPENRACEVSLVVSAHLSPRLPLLCGGNSSDIYLWWVLWISRRRTRTRRSSFALWPFLALVASAGVGGLFCICVESINLTRLDLERALVGLFCLC